MQRIRTLDLFAGAGGGLLAGVLLGWQSVAAVEVNPYCQKVLSRRQEDGSLPWFPIFPDIRRFDGRPWRGLVEAVTAGFPCQPWSTAGKGEGKKDGRNLWPETIRTIREVGPPVAFLENVPGLLAHDYFGVILGDLAEGGYDAEWDVVSAGAVGAPHLRERLWVLAYTQQSRWLCWEHPEREHGSCDEGEPGTGPEGSRRLRPVAGQVREAVSVAAGDRLEREVHRQNSSRKDEKIEKRGKAVRIPAPNLAANAAEDRQGLRQDETGNRRRKEGEEAGHVGDSGGGGWWDAEPGMGRVADGVAHLVDRIEALGNGQVPLVAAAAFRILAARSGLIRPEADPWASWLLRKGRLL